MTVIFTVIKCSFNFAPAQRELSARSVTVRDSGSCSKMFEPKLSNCKATFQLFCEVI